MKELISKVYYIDEQAYNQREMKRNYYIDNLKFILMILVVVGHFGLKLTYFAPIKILIYFIYIFHMPCFIFVSGFLAKRINAGGRLRVDKIINILWMYFIFKIINTLITFASTGKLNFDFLKDSTAPWYLIALSIWYLTVPFIERIHTRYLISGSILVGLMIGYFSSIRSVLSLSRVFVFFPFFIMGFCLSEQMLNKFLNKHIRMLAVIYLSALLVLILLFSKQLAPVSDIIYGGSPYNVSLGALAPFGLIIRGIWYILAFITSAALMLLVPRCRMFFSSYGGRTLQVYMSHIWCRSILVYAGFFEIIRNASPLFTLLVMIGCVGLTFLLSNGLLNHLFDLLSGKKLIERLIKK